MKNKKRTTIYFEAFEGMHDIVNEWAEQSTFTVGGVVVPKYINENNASYCFQVNGPRIHTYITIFIKNNKVQIQAWTKYDNVLRESLYYLLPDELPLSRKSFIGLSARSRLKKQFNHLLENLGQRNF